MALIDEYQANVTKRTTVLSVTTNTEIPEVNVIEDEASSPLTNTTGRYLEHLPEKKI